MGLTVVSVSRVVELFMRSLTELALSLGSGHGENLSKQQHWEVAKGSLRAARGPWLSSLSSSRGMPRLSSSLFRRPPVGWRPSVGPSSPSLKNSGIFDFPAQVSGQSLGQRVRYSSDLRAQITKWKFCKLNTKKRNYKTHLSLALTCRPKYPCRSPPSHSWAETGWVWSTAAAFCVYWQILWSSMVSLKLGPALKLHYNCTISVKSSSGLICGCSD